MLNRLWLPRRRPPPPKAVHPYPNVVHRSLSKRGYTFHALKRSTLNRPRACESTTALSATLRGTFSVGNAAVAMIPTHFHGAPCGRVILAISCPRSSHRQLHRPKSRWNASARLTKTPTVHPLCQKLFMRHIALVHAWSLPRNALYPWRALETTAAMELLPMLSFFMTLVLSLPMALSMASAYVGQTIPQPLSRTTTYPWTVGFILLRHTTAVI